MFAHYQAGCHFYFTDIVISLSSRTNGNTWIEKSVALYVTTKKEKKVYIVGLGNKRMKETLGDR